MASVGHWLVEQTEATVFQFVVIGAVLTPLWKWLKGQLDPSTPGGLGDVPDVEGVKAWERLAGTTNPGG